MKALLRRELRRQLPVALAILGLAALMVGGVLGLERFRGERLDGLLACLAVVSVGAPFLLALNGAAPDCESGAMAFLGRLPLSRRRELLARWTAAALLGLGVIGVAAIPPAVLAPLAHDHAWGDRREWAYAMDLFVRHWNKLPFLYPLVAFATGAVASSAVGRTLHALVLAPLFLVPALATKLVAERWAFFESAHPTFGILLAAAVLAGAALAAHLRGDVHRRSLRPAVLAGLVLVGCLAAASTISVQAEAATTAYRAADAIAQRGPRRSYGLALPGGRLFLETERTAEAFPLPEKMRVRVVDREAGAGAWLESENVRPQGLSPDGGLIAGTVDGDPPALELRDRATGRAERRVLPAGLRRQLPGLAADYEPTEAGGGYLEVGGPGPAAACAGYQLVWRGRTPLLLGSEPAAASGGELRLGRATLWGLEGARMDLPGLVWDAAGSRILVRGEDRAFSLVDVSRQPLAPEAVRWPEGFWPGTVRLAPSGDVLFALGERDRGPEQPREPVLLVAPLGGDPLAAPVLVPLPQAERSWAPAVTVGLSPSERSFVLTTSLDRRVVFRETRTGALVADVEDEGGASDNYLFWSPDEQTVVSRGGWWLAVGTSPRPEPVPTMDGSWLQASLLDGRRLVVGGRAPRVVDLATGAVSPAGEDPWRPGPR